jgi:hypothetical protein
MTSYSIHLPFFPSLVRRGYGEVFFLGIKLSPSKGEMKEGVI